MIKLRPVQAQSWGCQSFTVNYLLVVNNQLHILMTIFLNRAGCARGTMLGDTNADAEANHQERGKERKSEAGAGGLRLLNCEPWNRLRCT